MCLKSATDDAIQRFELNFRYNDKYDDFQLICDHHHHLERALYAEESNMIFPGSYQEVSKTDFVEFGKRRDNIEQLIKKVAGKTENQEADDSLKTTLRRLISFYTVPLNALMDKYKVQVAIKTNPKPLKKMTEEYAAEYVDNNYDND